MKKDNKYWGKNLVSDYFIRLCLLKKLNTERGEEEKEETIDEEEEEEAEEGEENSCVCIAAGNQRRNTF